jgi:molecular chaperone GrpE (heat shock protein)
MENVIEKNRQSASYSQQQLAELKAQLDTPWEQEQELAEKAAQLEKLDIELSQDMASGREQANENVFDEEPEQDMEDPEMEMS